VQVVLTLGIFNSNLNKRKVNRGGEKPKERKNNY